MRGYKSIFVSSKHKIQCSLTHEKYFQTINAVDTLPLTLLVAGSWIPLLVARGGGCLGPPLEISESSRRSTH